MEEIEQFWDRSLGLCGFFQEFDCVGSEREAGEIPPKAFKCFKKQRVSEGMEGAGFSALELNFAAMKEVQYSGQTVSRAQGPLCHCFDEAELRSDPSYNQAGFGEPDSSQEDGDRGIHQRKGERSWCREGNGAVKLFGRTFFPVPDN